jgi:hypothetical protein
MNLRKVFSRYRKQRDQFILNFRKTTRPESREIISMKRPTIFGIFLLLSLGGAAFTHAQAPTRDLRSLQGTWVMKAADEISADGTRATNFGEHPKGLFVGDANDRHSLQIFRTNRAPFASGDKTEGTPDEYRQVGLGSSIRRRHGGLVRLAARRVLSR